MPHRISAPLVILLLAGLIAVGGGVGVSGQPGGNPTPGLVASLVERAAEPSAQQQLSAAVNSEHAAVRAAAARVIFVAGIRGLAPAVEARLRDEADPDVAFARSAVSMPRRRPITSTRSTRAAHCRSAVEASSS